MDFKIVWTPKAEFRYEQIILYLKDNWSKSVQIDFYRTVKDKLELLRLFPNMGMKFSNRNYRKLLLTEHSYLHYRIKDDKIVLLTIKDTRQNPKQ